MLVLFHRREPHWASSKENQKPKVGKESKENHVETPISAVRPESARRAREPKGRKAGRHRTAPCTNKKRTRQFLRVRSLRRTETLNRSTTRGLHLHHRGRNPHHRRTRNARNIHAQPRTSHHRHFQRVKRNRRQAQAGNVRLHPRPIGFHPCQRHFLPRRHGFN